MNQHKKQYTKPTVKVIELPHCASLLQSSPLPLGNPDNNPYQW